MSDEKKTDPENQTPETSGSEETPEIILDNDGNLFEGEEQIGRVEENKIVDMDGNQIGEIDADGEAIFYVSEDEPTPEQPKKDVSTLFSRLSRGIESLSEKFDRNVGAPARFVRRNLTRAYDLAMMPVRDNILQPMEQGKASGRKGTAQKRIVQETAKNTVPGAAASTALVALLPVIDVFSTGGIATIAVATLYGRPVLDRLKEQSGKNDFQRDRLPDDKKFFPSVRR